MKTLKKTFLIILLIPMIFLLNACSLFNEEQIFVTDIVKTEQVGNVATYTIYYSNNTTSTLTVENGTDGQNGDDLTIEKIKSYCETNNINFESFLKEYFSINQVVEKTKTIEDATNIALQSAVTIWCEFPITNGSEKETAVSCGAGVIYKMEETYSYIITNYHVVYMQDCHTSDNIARNITIFQYGTSEHLYEVFTKNDLGFNIPVYDDYGYPEISYGDGAVPATYVGGALTYDLAVIKVPTAELLKYNPYATPVKIASSYNVGETAIAIGNPECEGFSVTSGIVSVSSEEINMLGANDITECSFRVMRVDTAVNGGNSGGGLFNINGELLGIVNAKAVASEIDNIAFAIPYDNVSQVVDNILYYYNGISPSKVKKLTLGIQYTVENSRGVYDPTTNKTTITDESLIRIVDEDSVAELMGFKPGDTIKTISINGNKHTITRYYQFGDLLLSIRAGDKILVEVERVGETELRTLSLADENGVLESYLTTVD